MDEVAELKKRIRDLEGMKNGLVITNAVLRERPDLPLDRLPVAREIAKMVGEMAMLRDENEKLKARVAHLEKQLTEAGWTAEMYRNALDDYRPEW